MEEYYLIKKSEVDAKLDSLSHLAGKLTYSEEVAISGMKSGITTLVEKSKLVDLSNNEILNKGENHIEKQGVYANPESFFDGYVAALQDLKK